MTSSKGNVFRVTGPLCGESTGHRWIPLSKASGAALVFSLMCAWTNGWANNRDAGLSEKQWRSLITVMTTGGGGEWEENSLNAFIVNLYLENWPCWNSIALIVSFFPAATRLLVNYSDVTCVPCLKPPTTRLLVQQLTQTYNKENIKLRTIGTLRGGHGDQWNPRTEGQ